MQIKINGGDGFLFTLSDEKLDNDNFVETTIVAPDGVAIECTLPLADLMPALVAFDAKRSRRLSDEGS